jgi:hypothetical protein
VPSGARNIAVWKRNAWWREGKRWVRLEKKENMAIWEAKLPPGMANAPPVPNKTDRLCRRTVNVIMVDPPYPECEPGNSAPRHATPRNSRPATSRCGLAHRAEHEEDLPARRGRR